MTKNVKVELQKWSLQELFRKRNSLIYVRVTMLLFDLDLLSTSSGMEDQASSLRIQNTYHPIGIRRCQHSQSQVNQQISQFKTDLALSEIPFEITSLISRIQITLHTRKIPLSAVTCCNLQHIFCSWPPLNIFIPHSEPSSELRDHQSHGSGNLIIIL